MAKLTLVAGYVVRQFSCPNAVTHPSTNRAQCRATALIETNALPLHQSATYNKTVYSPSPGKINYLIKVQGCKENMLYIPQKSKYLQNRPCCFGLKIC